MSISWEIPRSANDADDANAANDANDVTLLRK
jgi:hypothetical protein